LREATADLHRRAERSGVIADLLHGRATRSGYALWLRNLLPAYRNLEAALCTPGASARFGLLASPVPIAATRSSRT
jgi:heme oxygenase